MTTRDCRRGSVEDMTTKPDATTPGKRMSYRNRPATLRGDDRARQAADLRVAGNSWAAIADHMEYASSDSARKAVSLWYDKHNQETVEELRPVLMDRADMLWRSVVARLRQADDQKAWEGVIRSATSVLTFHARIGGVLDQPPTVEVNVHDQPTVQDMRDRFRRILEQSATPPQEIE